MSPRKDPYATRFDKGVNLGAQFASNPVLVGRSIQLGGVFDDIGNWFSNAARDVGKAFEDAFNAIGGAFEDAFVWIRRAIKWLADGPIMHIAAGVCAIIPVVGPGLALGVEGAYAAIQAADELIGKVEGMTEAVVAQARAAIEQVASDMGVSIPAGINVDAKLAELVKLSNAGNTDARNALVIHGVMRDSIALSAKYPDILTVKGAANLVKDKRVPEPARRIAACSIVAGLANSGNEDYRRHLLSVLGQYMRGAVTLPTPSPAAMMAAYKEASKLGSFKAAREMAYYAVAQMMVSLGQPLSLGPLTPAPLPTTYAKPVLPGTYLDERGKLHIERVRSSAIAAGKTISYPVKLKTKFGAPKSSSLTITNTTLLEREKFLTSPLSARGSLIFDKYNRAVGIDKAPIADAVFRAWQLDPYRPTLIQRVIEAKGAINLTVVPLRSFFPGLNDELLADYFSNPEAAYRFASQERARFLALPPRVQLQAVVALANNPLTVDNLGHFADRVYRTGGVVPWFTWARPFNLDPQEESRALVSKMNVAVLNWEAEQASNLDGAAINVDSVSGAVGALTGDTIIREGVLVTPGVIGSTDGRWSLVDIDGPDVVVSVDGTCELGTWKHA